MNPKQRRAIELALTSLKSTQTDDELFGGWTAEDRAILNEATPLVGERAALRRQHARSDVT
jgi:hypothetical protein